VTVDGNGNVYVTDRLNNRVQKFSSSGAFLAKWGSYGTGNGQFNNPNGVGVDGSGNVYVTDRSRVQKFTSGGGFVASYGSSGSGDGQFANPGDIGFDASGNIYVVDTENHRIQKFSSSFTFLSKWGGLGMTPGLFFSPWGLGVSQTGYLYVADTNNNRIQKFGPVSGGGGGGNTPSGNNILVQLIPGTDLTYANVTGPGQTNQTVTSTGSKPPHGLLLVPSSPAKYYNVTTTATYSGMIEVAIDYNPADVRGSEAALMLFHWDERLNPPSWREITTQVSTGPNTIVGLTGSLSTFAVMEPGSPTGIGDEPGAGELRLHPSSPNPFRADTRIAYDIVEPAPVRLLVFDLSGRVVRRVLDSAEQGAGSYSATWDGRDEDGSRVVPGLYFFCLETLGQSRTQKVLLID
jgi:hypothetical protein